MTSGGVRGHAELLSLTWVGPASTAAPFIRPGEEREIYVSGSELLHGMHSDECLPDDFSKLGLPLECRTMVSHEGVKEKRWWLVTSLNHEAKRNSAHSESAVHENARAGYAGIS